MNDSKAYFVLSHLQGIGPVRIKQLLMYYPCVSNILSAKRQSLEKINGIGPKIAELLTTWHKYVDIDLEIKKYKIAGIKFITQADDEYPSMLKEIYDPPFTLFVRGSSDVLENKTSSIAIVGSRRTSRYGINMCEVLSRSAAFAGWTVVSGLARGIDTVAHKTVLKNDGITLAVIGSGLGCIYPQENVTLANEIISNGGAVLSEFPIMQKPDRRSFPMRNRIISGLTRGVIVVEGGLKSGSMITANHALEQNRQVFAVPGQVDNPQSHGCHKLIKNGAKLTENFSDVLEEFEFQPILPLEFNELKGKETQSIPENINISELEKEIVEFLIENPVGVSIDELIEKTGKESKEILSSLMMLEIKKIVRQLPGMRFASSSSLMS